MDQLLGVKMTTSPLSERDKIAYLEDLQGVWLGDLLSFSFTIWAKISVVAWWNTQA